MHRSYGYIGAALAAAIAVSSIDVRPATAAPKAVAPATIETAAPTDVSARKRYRTYRRSGNAAAAAAFVGVVGTIAAIAAAEQRRKHYRRHYYAPYPYGYYAAPYGYYGHRYPYYYGYPYRW